MTLRTLLILLEVLIGKVADWAAVAGTVDTSSRLQGALICLEHARSLLSIEATVVEVEERRGG